MEYLRWVFRYGNWSPTREQWLNAAKHVQAEERDRIARFAFQNDAKASMSGRLLMRKAVRDLTGLRNTAIFFTRSEFGRPVLPIQSSDLDFDFNISHQGGLTVLVAGPKCKVGVDVMRVETARGTRSTAEFFRLMDRQFNDDEWMCIRGGLTEAEQMRRFYRHWCLKESFVKAVGTGIGYELKRLQCHLRGLSPRGPFISAPDQIAKNWHFEEHDLGDDFVAAISWNTSETVSCGNFVEISIEDLLVDDPLVMWLDDSYWTNFAAKDVKPM